MAEIFLEKVWKIFENKGERVEAVKGIELLVKDSELIVLLGPSGCGKTTTLRMIAGLEKPTQGKVYIDGKNVTEKPARQRDIAFVFQSYALYPHLTVYQNVEFPLKAQGVPKKERRKRVREVLEFLQIWDFRDQYPQKLDSGRQQKVAIARAIVRRPKAFLLDEPLSNLDAKVREFTRGELKRIHMDLRVTTVYVTHDQVEAMSLAERIVVMRDGTIQQVGSPREVYENPANLFVANFIGSPGMNFFKAKLSDERDIVLNGSYLIKAQDIPSYSSILRSFSKEEIILGIRPEYIKVSCSERAWIVQVDLIEPLGHEKVVNFSSGSTRGKIRLLRKVSIREGEEIKILLDPSKIRLFDPETGYDLIYQEEKEPEVVK